jgi:WD40 repeat protein
MMELNPVVASEYDDALLELAFGVEASQGQFKLILARCNHRQLRSRAITGLKSLVDLKIQELQLTESTQTLLKTIQSTVAHPFPDALTIWGFECVFDLDRLLNATNQVREEFRKFPFPIILWVNDEVLRKLIILVPDFESWATITEFTLATSELTELLNQHTKRIFRELLAIDASRFLMGHPLMKAEDRREFSQTLDELRSRKVSLEPELRANVQFILGRHEYEQDELESANQKYVQSLSFWENASDHPISVSALEKQAIVLLHLGLSYFRLADLQSTQSREHWQTARHYFQACIEVLDAANRRDLVSRFITYLSEVLRYLEAWKDLKNTVDRAVPLHQQYGRPLQLAADYGFLAEIAIQDRHWPDVDYWATQALGILETISIDTPHAPYHLLLNQFYRLLLVKAQFKRQKQQQANQNLERAVRELSAAIEASTPCYDPHRYLRILDALWRLYFDEGRYLEAFQIKLKRRSVAAAYGFRAFIGAGRLEAHQQALALTKTQLKDSGSIASEIQTSRRQQDVNNLLERVLRHDGKLTIMYGPSGVGKSSLIHAGLIPAIQALPNLRKTVPVVVQVYTDWGRELGKKLAKALGMSIAGLGINGNESNGSGSGQDAIANATNPLAQCFLPDGDGCTSNIVSELRKNDERNLQVVIIFEQFEEFFFNYQTLPQRRKFYEFLDEIWKLSYVTLIISIREDYFDNLLEIERLTDLDLSHQDLLTRKNRYHLGNFLPEDAIKIVRSLTARSHFYLEENLIDRLVRDLARDQGEVRPIELQIVGARLQEEDIHTLEKYEQTGTLTQLVQRYIDEAIDDCGAENQKIAQLILYFLTADNQTRLLKTKAELAQDLGENTENLDIVLKILRKSGLIVSLPEIPHHQYKLVHDYLVPIIRRQQKLAKQAEEQKFRQEYQLLRERDEAREKQKQSDTRFIRVLIACLIGAVFSVVSLGGLAWLFYSASKAAAIAEIEAQNSASKAMLLSDQQFDALFTSVKAGKKLQKLKSPSQPILTSETLSQLQHAFHSISERNRLEGHTNNVLDVAFNANGQFIATASTDETVKLWSPDGTLLHTLDPQQKAITSVSFSPDGQLLATSGIEPTVNLWQIQACDNDSICIKPFAKLQGHQEPVNRVSFSPDGLYLITASADKTVKLWKPDGTLVKTLSGHTDWVLDVSFSPDGQTIASASKDQTVRLWDLQGKTLKTLQGHDNGVSSVAFSPDGKTIVTGSADRRIKLWTREGKLLHTLKKPNGDRVWDVSFSPDGTKLASAHEDNTVRLWTLDGQPIRTLSGHRKPVRSLAFSPDRQTLATASEDNTVKLWDVTRDPNWQPHHSQGVLAVSFSPDGQMLATASEDKTVKLWPRQGQHSPKLLSGHTQAVNWVGFSPDGQTLASGSDDGWLRLWDKNGVLLRSLEHGDAVKSASFSQDSQTIATAGGTTLTTLKLWNIKGTMQHLLAFDDTMKVQSVALSSDGQWMVTGHSDKTVRLWTIQGRLVDTRSGHMGTVNWVSFSPDGETIASASEDKTVQLWKLKNGSLESIRTLQGHIGPVNWVSFSPDGQTIASASSDRTVKLWQAEDGQLLTTFEGHQEAVWSIAFSPDGKTLASASKDKTVLLWNLDLDKLLTNSCTWIEDYLQHNQTVKDRDRDLCDD